MLFYIPKVFLNIRLKFWLITDGKQLNHFLAAIPNGLTTFYNYLQKYINYYRDAENKKMYLLLKIYIFKHIGIDNSHQAIMGHAL